MPKKFRANYVNEYLGAFKPSDEEMRTLMAKAVDDEIARMYKASWSELYRGHDPGFEEPAQKDLTMETDEEFRARLRYSLGDDRELARAGGRQLDEVAERYGLKRQKKDLGSRATEKIYR